MNKIAIIGGGIVGSTAAFYLTREGYDVTLYDEGLGQATKAAVGIICPWVSQRRNQWWYQLVDDGSIFYHQLIKDVKDASFYQRSGALLVNEKRLDKMYELALLRRHSTSIMGEVKIVSGDDLSALLPKGSISDRALYIEGAARVDGGFLVESLITESVEKGMRFIKERVSFTVSENQYCINEETYDQIILASGAWLKSLLPGYAVDVRPQKGQLIEFDHHVDARNYPLFIPKGEIDLLYKQDGSVVVGASHDDEGGFDLAVEVGVSRHLQALAVSHLPSLEGVQYDRARVGTRAYSSDFLPFYGQVEGLEGCFAASGLGSSGLTSGPIIGYRLAQQVMGKQTPTFTDNYIRPL